MAGSVNDKSRKTVELHFAHTNGPVDDAIDQLMDRVGGIAHPDIVREIILAGLKAGQENTGRMDLKLMNTSMKEMRFTAKVFGPYRSVRKVTVFGSARVRAGAPLYQMAHDLGKKLAEAGFMVITGGGPGIMQATNEGAGPEHSFGVNIRLPFEQKPNPVLIGNPRYITYKYFFNRKVAFLKEAHAVVLFPGGFGTMDEAMESITLLQTGKRYPLPLILVDTPDGTYWERLFGFLEKELSARGYISRDDFGFIDRVTRPEAAVERIRNFYSRYHSLRYVDEQLVIRLASPLTESDRQRLQDEFTDILTPGGAMRLSGALEEEENETELARLPRLVVDFNNRDFGRLRQLVNAINAC
ncbi:TIGR00730 family Rossman fold protein [Desulfosarcina ovata]|uniref:AMP nucleosidase n=2 Tax=Desulfosarcina ovata TaxID=83564 RepID=A0A5K8AHJ8_9BACT|nr:TIGR00730 family Rossman fold protein [Desulfosarcina ovata]BBO85281.1 Rossman fold protein, TIGR00730 family [Desulfosarcina ovata subsp. sediminis]BBO92173.1 Rossman fold protein, TIGR00730 family [Desulfosarcina ovata subsp. ovata]